MRQVDLDAGVRPGQRRLAVGVVRPAQLVRRGVEGRADDAAGDRVRHHETPPVDGVDDASACRRRSSSSSSADIAGSASSGTRASASQTSTTSTVIPAGSRPARRRDALLDLRRLQGAARQPDRVAAAATEVEEAHRGPQHAVARGRRPPAVPRTRRPARRRRRRSRRWDCSTAPASPPKCRSQRGQERPQVLPVEADLRLVGAAQAEPAVRAACRRPPPATSGGGVDGEHALHRRQFLGEQGAAAGGVDDRLVRDQEPDPRTREVRTWRTSRGR